LRYATAPAADISCTHIVGRLYAICRAGTITKTDDLSLRPEKFSGSIMASATPTAQVRNILVLVLVRTITRTSTRKRQRLFHAVRPHVANPVIKTQFSL
jgi:hypothetical protein